MNFRTVGVFSNETDEQMIIYLEMSCEEIHMSPGYAIELLAEDNEDYFPMTILYHKGSLQIYPRKGSPKWRFRFNGKEFDPDFPSKLSELN